MNTAAVHIVAVRMAAVVRTFAVHMVVDYTVAVDMRLEVAVVEVAKNRVRMGHSAVHMLANLAVGTEENHMAQAMLEVEAVGFDNLVVQEESDCMEDSHCLDVVV